MKHTSTKSRQIFALDLEPRWKEEFEKTVLPHFQDEKTMASLARRIIKEIVSCFLTEQQMRDRGLLALYKSLGKPDALLFAIRKSEELRRGGDVGSSSTTSGTLHNKPSLSAISGRGR